MIDMHVHSRFSPDTEESMERQCRLALACGLEGLCFTEHWDIDETSLGAGHYDRDGYFAEIDRCRSLFGKQLRILSGVEFSEPQNHPKELAYARTLPYDFLLGATHYFCGGRFPPELLKAGVSAAEMYGAYWEEMRRMAACGGVDCVAHLDLPKRYYRCLQYTVAEAKEILSLLIEQGIVIEINTSAFANGFKEAHPADALLQLYKDCGGREVTVGTDSHWADERSIAGYLAEGYKKAAQFGLAVRRYV
ncbi:MAG: histidinol-phosphatase HisJ family protein [Oscillospiraceae bacterium]|jgi:histidinol-phosphatase (PHP family)|nr:histidinol-phosphatase HisJ family protein [Oscillospiraceae bacterium]